MVNEHYYKEPIIIIDGSIYNDEEKANEYMKKIWGEDKHTGKPKNAYSFIDFEENCYIHNANRLKKL